MASSSWESISQAFTASMRSCSRPGLRQELVHLLRRHLFAELHVQLVIAVEQCLDLGDAFLDVAFDRLRFVEPGLLLKEPDGDAVGGKRLADELGVVARHDFEQRALAGAVEAKHADFGPGRNESQMSLRTWASGGCTFPSPFIV
jgi:hypothetical protein